MTIDHRPSLGGNPTWWPPCPASSTSSSATPSTSPAPSRDSPTFHATKKRQLRTFAAVRFLRQMIKKSNKHPADSREHKLLAFLFEADKN